MKLNRHFHVRFLPRAVKLCVFALVASMVILPPLDEIHAAQQGLSLTCDSTSLSGDTLSVHGTWEAIDYIGQADAYDVAVVVPSGAVIDASSQDPGDSFVSSVGDFGGRENRPDIMGTWSNQFPITTVPIEIGAMLYHGQIGGAESSPIMSCPYEPPSCGDGIDNDSIADGLIDFPEDPGCSSVMDDDEYDEVIVIPDGGDIPSGGAGNVASTTLTIFVQVVNGPVPTMADRVDSDFNIEVHHVGGVSLLADTTTRSIVLPPGAYSVDAATLEGYGESSLTSECEGTLQEGEHTTCTVSYEQDRYEITGIVWNDTDADNTIDPSEGSMEGWEVLATNGNDHLSAVTDHDGAYVLNVPQGSWTVRAQAPDGWESSTIEHGSFSVTLPQDLGMAGEERIHPLAKLFHFFIPTAHAALMGTINGVNFGQKAIAQESLPDPQKGNGIRLSLSSNREGDTDETYAAIQNFPLSNASIIDSDEATPMLQEFGVTDTQPEGDVLGAVTTQLLPLGAPNTGAGGSNRSPTIVPIVALLGMLLLVGVSLRTL